MRLLSSRLKTRQFQTDDAVSALDDGGVGEAGPPIVDPGNRVDGHFTVHDTTMTGTLFSTKCSCTTDFTFYKQ
jgi:hypothetical protein